MKKRKKNIYIHIYGGFNDKDRLYKNAARQCTKNYRQFLIYVYETILSDY